MTRDLLAVGDVMLDGFLPEPERGRAVHGSIELRPGGSALNVALTAASLGARAAVAGRIGADVVGRLIEGELAIRGVESLLARDRDAPTGCVIVVGTSIVADPGANLRFAPSDLQPSLEAGSIIVSGYSLLQPGSEAAARAALTRAKTAWLAVDVASVGLLRAFGVDRFFAATGAANVLIANELEAHALTGESRERGALALARRYELVCVMLGREGVIAAVGGELVRVEATPVDGARELGAGDTFAGALLVSLARGVELADALAAGCEAVRRSLEGIHELAGRAEDAQGSGTSRHRRERP